MMDNQIWKAFTRPGRTVFMESSTQERAERVKKTRMKFWWGLPITDLIVLGS